MRACSEGRDQNALVPRMTLQHTCVIFMVLSGCGSFHQKLKRPALSAVAQKRRNKLVNTLSSLMTSAHLTAGFNCIWVYDIQLGQRGHFKRVSWTKLIRHLIQGKEYQFLIFRNKDLFGDS